MLGAQLGAGGQGAVFEATDRVTGEVFALKLHELRSPHRLPLVRREVAALRWLRFPGVVHLVDEGVADGRYFQVMERVAGTPFLGPQPGGVPLRWEDVQAPTIALLALLGLVHAAGLVHRDLKPSNVLLPPDGRPVLLDFGLVGDLTIPESEPLRGGTPGYAAPEQMLGGVCDARTDLYAVGVMLYAALTGRMPPRPPGPPSAARPPVRPPPLGSLAAVPPAVATTVDALLEPDPARRPANAREVLARLGAATLDAWRPAGLPTTRVAHAEALRPLFSGPDVFHHLAEDGAALLFAASGGEPEALARTLAGWLHDGWARRDGERVSLDRRAIEHLRRGADDEVRRLLAQGAPAEALAIAARDAGRAARHEGELGSAQALLSLALLSARQAGSAAHECAIGADLAEVALSQETEAALDQALGELNRAPQWREDLGGIADLMRAALLSIRGQFERAEALLDALAPFAREDLEIWRQGVRATNARRMGDTEAERALATMVGWANTPLRRAKLDGWKGNLRYRQERYDEAAALHLASARGKTAVARVSSLLNAAWALLDGLRLEEAEALAEEAAAEAAARRHAMYEANARLVARNVAQRLGRAAPARPEWVDAASLLGPWLESTFALNEAAVAWRTGDTGLAGRLAARAERASLRGPRGPLGLLARALAWYCAGAPGDEAAALEAELPTCPAPGIAVQVYGLLRAEGHAEHLVEAALRWAECRPRTTWHQRLELLSFAEALGLQPLHPEQP